MAVLTLSSARAPSGVGVGGGEFIARVPGAVACWGYERWGYWEAIAALPVHQLAVGDVGHAGVAAGLNTFGQGWAAELRLRQGGTTQAGQVLTTASSDSERLDVLLAQSVSRMVAG